MWIAIVLFAGILGILLLIAFLDTRKPKNYPPGPKWLPILGCAVTLNKMRQQTGYLHKAALELSKQYGPVVRLKVGVDKLVIVDGYDLIKHVLTEDDFNGRPQGIFYKTRTWGIRRGIMFTDEEFWQEQRRYVIRHLREFGFGRRTIATMLEDEAEDLVRTFTNKIQPLNSGVVDMKDIFGVPVINTLWTMMANNRHKPEDEEMKTIQGLLTELFTQVHVTGSLFSHFPFLRYVAPDFSGYNSFVNTHSKIWAFLREEIDRHNSTYKADSARDLIDVYIQMLRSEDKKPSFSELQLVAICMDLFMAGSETTSKTLGFAFLYLLLYPDVQRKAQEEIDRVIGRDRSPLLSDRPNMPYMEALVLESLRLFMGGTVLLPHTALKDCYLHGYFIPKDTMVVANLHSVLMGTTYWDDPGAFRPDRFIIDNKVVIPDNYLPFGFGKRRCLGETMAKASVFLFATSLLQKFAFSVPPGQKPPTTETIDGVTPAPVPYDALVTARM